MRAFTDGNMLCITLDDFVNLQESPAVFIPLDCKNAKIIQRDGFRGLPMGDLIFIRNSLRYSDFTRSRSAGELRR